MSPLATLFSVSDDDRSSRAVISWWERRRLVFNAVVGIAATMNLAAFVYLNGVLLRPYLPFAEREWEPISLLVAPIAMNVCYCGGWLAEILLRDFTGRSRRFGPVAFALGLGFSVLVTFVPPIIDGVRWLSLARPWHG